MPYRPHASVLAAMLAAPLLMLVSTLIYLQNGKGISVGEVAGTVQLWAFAAFGVAIIGLARLGEHLRPRFTTWITVIGILGSVGGAAYGVDAIAADAYGVSVQDVGGGVTPFALRLPGLAFPLALVLLSALLLREHLAPRLAALLLCAEAVTFPASRIPDIGMLAVVSDVLGVLALTMIVLYLRDQHEASVRATLPSGETQPRPQHDGDLVPNRPSAAR